jgi:ubiquinol-cytochrome c reductase cytochrome b subunit
VTFLVSIVTGLTGYVAQSNFDSQWISTQAKDGINATGGGAYFNVLNLGQMLMWHIVLMPIVLIALVGIHVLMVRIKGVVPPFEENTVIENAGAEQ